MLRRLIFLTLVFFALALSASAMSLQSRATGHVNLPLRATCTTSASCQSDYCMKGRCATPNATGETCYKNAGCKSRLCDVKASRCVPLTSDHLIGLAQPVRQSDAYTKAPHAPLRFSQTSSVTSYGSVDVQKKDASRHTLHMHATGTSPAVVRLQFDKPIIATGNGALFFDYKITHFGRQSDNHAKARRCHLSTLFNAHALSLPISVHQRTDETHRAAFSLAFNADARDIAVVLKCDKHVKATVALSNVRMEEWKTFEEHEQKVFS